jgi:DNA-directed RNA polymerase specialized sigma24 family protein
VALAALPPAQREAVVLTLYLNLTEEQAAAVMRVSQAALRRHLAAAKSALRPVLPEGS